MTRTRHEFVIARPSELHPELEFPGRWMTTGKPLDAMPRANPRGPWRRFAAWRDGLGMLVVVVVAAVLLATAVAFWISPTP